MAYNQCEINIGLKQWFYLGTEGEVIVMDKGINFTQEELQLLYAACMNYGNKLSEIIKAIPNEEENIIDKLSGKAKESWSLARKITEYMK